MDQHNLAFEIVSILSLGILAQWISASLRIPSILLLILFGFVAGPLLNWIHPMGVFGDLLIPIVSLSIAVILFEGGMHLRFRDIRTVGYVIRNLVTVGAAVTIGASYLVLHFLLGMSNSFSILQSAILVVTGPTVIIPMLKQINLKQPLRSILRWEGIIIDPIGALVSVLIFDILLLHTAEEAFFAIILGIIKTVVVGVVFGYFAAQAILYLLRRFFIADALVNPVVLLFLFVSFVLSNAIQPETGLVSVTVMGMVLANQTHTGMTPILTFKENLRVILIAFLFIVLTGAIEYDNLFQALDESFIYLFFAIAFIRPLSVVVSTFYSSLSWKEVFYLSFVAPRGIIAASIASLFGLQLAGRSGIETDMFAPFTFTVIAGTVVFYGLFSPWLAKRLKLSGIPEQGVLIIGANLLARSIGEAIAREGYQVQLIDTNFWKVSEAKQFAVPVYYGSFLTFEGSRGQNLEGIGKVLAMTESDEVNLLAMNFFSSRFERAGLFQLPTSSVEVPYDQHGRILFGEKYLYEELKKFIEEGGVIKSSELTGDYTYQDWFNEGEQEKIPLFYMFQNGSLEPVSEGQTVFPLLVAKVIYLVKPSLE